MADEMIIQEISQEIEDLNKARDADIIHDSLPSAQPTQLNTPNTLEALNCISRQAVIEILGATWTIVERSESEDSRLTGCDGYCDWTTRTIVIERERYGNFGDMERYIRNVKRHEIVHAFLYECGLAESTLPAGAWAQNEEMVDWLARMGEQIYQAWESAGAIDG